MTQLLPALKAATQDLHTRLERRMKMFDPGFSKSDYTQLLRGFWGYYHPLEARLGTVPGLAERVPDLHLRAKTPWLEADLLALGLSPAEIAGLPLCPELPDLPDAAAALGCLYVAEGSTLGGQVIGPRLQGSLGIEVTAGGRFFSGYGPETGLMWRAFGGYCADVPASPGAIRGARATFETLEAWLDHAGVLREAPPQA